MKERLSMNNNELKNSLCSLLATLEQQQHFGSSAIMGIAPFGAASQVNAFKQHYHEVKQIILELNDEHVNVIMENFLNDHVWQDYTYQKISKVKKEIKRVISKL